MKLEASTLGIGELHGSDARLTVGRLDRATDTDFAPETLFTRGAMSRASFN